MGVDIIFEAKVREAFTKIKEDIDFLKKEILECKEDIKMLNSNKRVELRHEIEKSPVLNDISTGNIGVCCYHYDTSGPTMPIKPHKGDISTGSIGPCCYVDDTRNSEKVKFDISYLKNNLEKVFLSLTKTEFSIFLSVYQLEEEYKRPVSYSDIAIKLPLSLNSVRNHMNNLILKGIPLVKVVYGKAVLLSVLPEFKAMNLANKLLELRSFER